MARQFTLTITMGNDAMKSRAHVVRALRTVIHDLRKGLKSFQIYDLNGNHVGHWGFEESEEQDTSETPRDWIIAGMARAMFVSAWGDLEEDQGRSYPGQDLMDVAPETPDYVLIKANECAEAIEKANFAPLDALLTLAFTAEHKGKRDKNISITEWIGENAELFGHYLAMEAMGTGVSWSDDHARIHIKIPDYEFSMAHLE